MIILTRPDEKQINIIGCESRLSPAKIQEVADKKKLKDYSFKEKKIYTAERVPKLEYFEYLISY